MRTTLDLPDPLFRELKANAARRGVKMKDLLATFIENGLRNPPPAKPAARSPLPVARPATAPPFARSTTPRSQTYSTPKTPMPAIDLPDINVLLALACEDHQHHPRARQYWENEGVAQLAFCCVTMLGLLRLATNAKVMQDRPFSPGEARKIYRDFSALPEVAFIAEPTDIEHQFAIYTKATAFSASHWTDAWLAAFASAAGCRIVSFDSGFRHFPELDFLHLSSRTTPG